MEISICVLCDKLCIDTNFIKESFLMLECTSQGITKFLGLSSLCIAGNTVLQKLDLYSSCDERSWRYVLL
jgi:hypothetical protein